MKSYGLPYMGSKNRIAKRIIDIIPACDCLVDLFAGGCAITHAALLSRKFGRIICNDFTDTPQLFLRAARGEFNNDTRWVDRETFFREKEKDPYVRLLWSFGGKGTSYIYHRDKEVPFKQMHEMAVRLTLPETSESISDTNKNLAKDIPVKYKHIVLNHIARLHRLQGIYGVPGLDSLTVTQKDYRDVEIPDGAIVYCDPPYCGTCEYYNATGFDSRSFFEWVRDNKHPVFVSEYNAPDYLHVVDRWEIRSLMSATNKTSMCTENLYANDAGISLLRRTKPLLFESATFA